MFSKILPVLLFVIGAFAQDTTRLEPAAELPITRLLRVEGTKIIASVRYSSGEVETDMLRVFDIANPYRPEVEGNFLPIRTRLMWDEMHYRPKEYHADALLVEDFILTGINRSCGYNDISPFGFKVGPLTVEAESFDHRSHWNVIVSDSIYEECENPEDLTIYSMPGRLMLRDSILYYAAGSWGLRRYNTSDISHPVEIDTFSYKAHDILPLGELVIIFEENDIIALNVSNYDPVEVWRQTLGSEEFRYTACRIVDEYLIMGIDNPEQNLLQFTVFQFIDRNEPEIIAEFDIPFSNRNAAIWINSNRFYLFENNVLTVYRLEVDFFPIYWKQFTLAQRRARIYPFGNYVFSFDPEGYPEIEEPEGYIYDLENLKAPDSEGKTQPATHFILSAFPNPFNSSTTISYLLPSPGRYAIDVIDIQGRLVTRLSDGWREAGSYWEVLDGRRLGSGQYMLRLNTLNTINTMQLIYIK